MSLIKTFPTLYSQNKSGKLIMWSAKCYEKSDNTAYSSITWGLEDGKQQTATVDFTMGKNIGKKNETTASEQCISETQSKWQAKKDKENYSESREGNIREERFPMLAHTFDPERPSGITFPC